MIWAAIASASLLTLSCSSGFGNPDFKLVRTIDLPGIRKLELQKAGHESGQRQLYRLVVPDPKPYVLLECFGSEPAIASDGAQLIVTLSRYSTIWRLDSGADHLNGKLLVLRWK